MVREICQDLAEEGTRTKSGAMPLELAQVWKFPAVFAPHLQLLSVRQQSNLTLPPETNFF